MESTGRLFLCARCRVQVLICRRCDRGQIYCAGGCAMAARRASVQEAGRRYQQGRPGRFRHAERNRHYRRRRQKVTHQGSVPPAPDDLLASNPVVAAAVPATPSVAAGHCHFCGVGCPVFVRIGFLNSHRVPAIVPPDRRGVRHDHSP